MRSYSQKTKKQNKKVLLRERKRHTDRGVSSTPSAGPVRGVPHLGYPHRDLAGGYPIPARGLPHLRYYRNPHPDLARGVVPISGTPQLDLTGVPPQLDLAGVTPQLGLGWGTPPPWLDLARWGTPSWNLAVAKWGNFTPPPAPRQTDGLTDSCQNITFPRTTYTVGNKLF